MDPAPTLLDQWLDGVRRLDLASLTMLYHAQATVESPSETWMGREEIADGLNAARRLLKGMCVEHVVALEAQEGQLRFETEVRGKLGRARIRHSWTLSGQHIHDHVLEVMRHDKVAA